jgi:hypothetical protein
MVKNIDQFVDDNRRHDESRSKSKIIRALGSCSPCFGRFLGNYIVVLYLIVKFIFIANTIGQIFLIGGLLGDSYWFFGKWIFFVLFFYAFKIYLYSFKGYKFAQNLIQGHGWTIANSEYFPS